MTDKQRMVCPCCGPELREQDGGLVSCGASHKFKLHAEGDMTGRELELLNDPPNKCEYEKGDRFTVRDGVVFD